MLLIGLKFFLWLVKSKILCHGHTLLVILMVKKLMEYTWKRNTEDKSNRIYSWKSSQENGDNFNIWIDKKDVV